MKFKLILLGLILGCQIGFAQFAERNPKNTRFIAGGYADKAPYFSTITAALNNVKAYATIDNPYTFWLTSDTTYISDWVTMKDSMENYYILAGKIKWAGFGWMGVTVIDRTQNPYSTPEQYAPYDVDDNTISVQMAVDSSNGRIVLFQGEYLISDSIKTSNFEKVHIKFAEGAKIVSTVERPALGGLIEYFAPTGEVIFENGDELIIEDGSIEGNPSTSNGFQNVVCIKEVKRVKVSNTTIRKGKYAGVRAIAGDLIEVIGATIDSSGYANLLITGYKKSTVLGGDFSYAGYNNTTTETGYGVGFTGQFTYPYGSGNVIYNEDITVDGVTANYCSRYGIDSHGGLDITVINNKIKGFGTAAISGINEDGNTGFGKRVNNKIISQNIIRQDSLWLEERNFTGLGTTAFWSAIQAGDYQNNTTDEFGPSGSWYITSNILDSLQGRGSRASIFFLVSTSKPRPQIDKVEISFNTLINPTITLTKFDGNYGEQYDAAIMIGGGNIPPKVTHVIGNTVVGSGVNAIKLMSDNPWSGIDTGYSNYSKVALNTVIGTFRNPLFISSNNIHQLTFGNTYNNEELPNMNNAYNGNWTRFLKCQTIGDSLTIIDTTDVSLASDATVKFQIDVAATSDVLDESADYNYTARGLNNATDTFTLTEGPSVGHDGTDPNLYKPTLLWRTNGSKAVLKIFGSTAYTGYYISIKRSSRSLPIWRAE